MGTNLEEAKAFLGALAWVLVVIGMSFVLVYAQESKPFPEPTQNKLLKAQHAIDEAQAAEKDLQIQFDITINRQKELQAAYPALQGQEKAAQAALETAKDEALKAAGLDKAKFDVDMKTLAPVAKPEAPKASK